MSESSWGNHYTGYVGGAGGAIVLESGVLGPEPAAHGVLMFRENLITSAAAPARAEVTLRGGVTATKFLCDWGGQFSAVFSSIGISVLAWWSPVFDPDGIGVGDSPDIYGAGWDAGQYKFGAILGFGGWNTARPLTYTGRQRIVGDSGSGGWGAYSAIKVPALGRRFFPRVLRVVNSNYASSYAVLEGRVMPAHMAGLELAIPGVFCGPLTEALIRDGIDIGGASVVYMKNHGAGLTAVTPFFELAI
jgi:hypothetical protein